MSNNMCKSLFSWQYLEDTCYRSYLIFLNWKQKKVALVYQLDWLKWTHKLWKPNYLTKIFTSYSVKQTNQHQKVCSFNCRKMSIHHITNPGSLTLIYSPVWFVCQTKMALWIIVRSPVNQTPREGSIVSLHLTIHTFSSQFWLAKYNFTIVKYKLSILSKKSEL